MLPIGSGGSGERCKCTERFSWNSFIYYLFCFVLFVLFVCLSAVSNYHHHHLFVFEPD